MTLPARVLAALVGVLLVAGLLTAVLRDDDRVSTTAATSTTSTTVAGEATTSTTAAVTTDVERTIAEIEAFVSRARGLPFKSKVKATLLDDAAFRTRLREDDDVDREELAKTTKLLRALDLIEEDVDLEAAYNSLLSDAVLGFYDFEKDELVVRGSSLTPGVRQTLAHELTHALQDQHFELDRPELDERDDEAGLAFRGLVEGDARRIEREYATTFSRAEQRQAARQTTSSAIGADIPRVLIDSLQFPYAYGPPFADQVVSERRIDEAFRSPPTTSEHIIHPDAFLRGEQPRAVAEPPADGTVFDRGVVGEFGLVLILGDDLGGSDLRRAVNGWGGDRYVAWEADGRVCARVTVEMDTPRDADELRSALNAWARRHGGSVTGLTLTSCR